MLRLIRRSTLITLFCAVSSLICVQIFVAAQFYFHEPRSLLVDEMNATFTGKDPAKALDSHDVGGKQESRHFFHLPKGWLKLDTARVFVGGFSNGADFAHQFHLAFSGKISGACIVAGQPYHCATTYFGGSDPLVMKLSGNSVPFCHNCDYDSTTYSLYTLSEDHCKRWPDIVDISRLIDYVKRDPDLDDTSNLRDPRQRVFLFRATKDETYLPGSVAGVQGLYAQLMQDSNEQVLFEHSVEGGHGFIVSRDYDVAEECLKHVVFGGTKLIQRTGGNSASSGSGEGGSETRSDMQGPADGAIDYSNLYSFNQRQFEKDDDWSAGFGLKAWIYVPKACQANATVPSSISRGRSDGKGTDNNGNEKSGNDKASLDENEGDMCPLFVWFNPCGDDGLHYDVGAFEGWAETNSIVVLRPTVIRNNCELRGSAHGCGGAVTRGCWDVYGYHGKDYAKRSGPHMRLANRVIQYVLDRRFTDGADGD